MKNQILEKLTTLLTAAFGFVAALAWNDAIRAIFNTYIPKEEGIVYMLGYALLITIIAVFVTIWIGKKK